jgi:hypothetical protein
MAHLATRHSSKVFSTGDLTLTVEGGAPVTVYGIWLNNSAGSTQVFTIKNGAGVTIHAVEVKDETVVELSTQWKADKGLAISGIALCSVTVFHSGAGL